MSSPLNDSIDVWHGRLAGGEVIDQSCWGVLDESERRQAMKLKHPFMQARYVEVHGKTRRILAYYLQAEPERLAIGKEAHGKPYLVERPEWVFNLSHSADRIVLAVSGNCRLGVDIELCKPKSNLDGLVKKCFAVEEAGYWQALPEPEKTVGFYRFWTRKEAFVKATGRGIGLGLDRCVINPAKPSEMLRVPESFGPATAWRIADIDLGHEVACAVVNDNRIEKIMLREMNDDWIATL